MLRLVLAFLLCAAGAANAAETRELSPLERAAKQRGSGQAIGLPKTGNVATRPPTTLKVGPNKPIKRPSDAARQAVDGDTVEIDAGVYSGDVGQWVANNLTIRGVGGYAELKAAGQSAGGKAIWVVRGDNVRIEKIVFADARVRDKNGAGIRHEGGNLTLVDCIFRNNEDGILTVSNPQAEIVIERSEFDRNGHQSGYAHGIYVGEFKRLTVTGSYFHGTPSGHLIKSRALSNVIAYNRIMDEGNGTASYAIDLPNGGPGVVIGNLIQQGARPSNPGIVAYLMEKRFDDRDNKLFVVNNTIVNQFGDANFVQTYGGELVVANNILIGAGAVLHGEARLINNLLVPLNGQAPRVNGELNGGNNRGNKRANDARLVNLARYDYRLARGSPAAGAGIDPASLLGAAGIKLTSEYRHPRNVRPRRAGPPFDMGAYAAE